MKKLLLFCLSVAVGFSALAQIKQRLPNGFSKAELPSILKNFYPSVPYRTSEIDNGVPVLNQQSILRAPSSSSFLPGDEFLIGNTFYDLQTNNSISNRLVLSSDGSLSGAWTYSPNAIQTTTPPYPSRGSGYNYFDGTNWLYPSGPSARQENVRVGFTNIVVTGNGIEMLIAHNAVGTTDSNQIAVTRRAVKGTGAWTTTYPWGHSYDTWPKATGNGGKDTAYVVFQGSGASASTTAPAHVVLGQTGPIFFSRTIDGGVTWSPKVEPVEIDSTHYVGFGGDSYSIDAKGSVVAISFGDTYTDVGLLKSTDGGLSWVKTIIQKHPIPFYGATGHKGTFYIGTDTICDTVYSNGGDSKVLIDNAGKCHVWFSLFAYHDKDTTDVYYSPHYGSDALYYWNEDMGPDSDYVQIATAQDFNGNGTIDTPVDTFTTCTPDLPWGNYGGGITQMPSAGIDPSGKIYVTYQTIDELADTTFYHESHRHVYMMTLAPDGSGHYNAAEWTYPYDIVPDIASGGDGENQEAVFACTARDVDANYAYVLYQRDNAPGHGLAADGSCDKVKNLGNSSDIVLCRVDVTTVGIKTANTNDLFVSQNYPNPSKGSTYVNIGLKKSSEVKVEIFDMIGRTILSESKGVLPAGSHSLHFDTSNMNTGVYSYSVIAGGYKTTHKMIVE